MKASESQRLRVLKKKYVPDFKLGKTKTHEEIERDTKNFLNSGGAITIVPAGETGADNFVTYPNRKVRKKQDEYRKLYPASTNTEWKDY